MKEKYALVPYAEYKQMVKGMDVPNTHRGIGGSGASDNQQSTQDTNPSPAKEIQNLDRLQDTMDPHKTTEHHVKKTVTSQEPNSEHLSTPHADLVVPESSPTEHIDAPPPPYKKRIVRTAKKPKLSTVAQLPIVIGKLQKNKNNNKKHTAEKNTDKPNNGDQLSPKKRLWLRG